MKEELLPPCNLEEEIEKRLKNLQTTLMEKDKTLFPHNMSFLKNKTKFNTSNRN